MTLIEKDLRWTWEYIDLFNNEQYRPEYLKLNPKGVVPTLIHEDRAIIESTLICEYLDQTFPEPSLVPGSAYERSQMRRWSKHIDEGVVEATREISFSAMFRDKMKSMTQEQRDGRFRNIGDPGRRARMISTYEQGCESPFVEQGMRLRNYSMKWKKCWSRVRTGWSERDARLAISTLSPSQLACIT